MIYLITYSKAADSDFAVATLATFGNVTNHIPQIRLVTLNTTSSRIPEIAALDFVLAVKKEKVFSPLMDVPNDPLWSSMGHLTRINALTAWDKATGAGITIAVIDAGVSTVHPDLAANLLTGWCVITNTTDTNPVSGGSQHGTGCAGIAAAVTGNAIGMAGVARNAKILPVRASTIVSGGAAEGKLAEGIIWAADNGADVCSVSFAVNSSPAVAAAAEYANSLGCIVVCAGPNVSASYVYDLDITRQMINVCGVSPSNVRQYAYGDWLDLCAPYATTTTYDATGYAAFSGNSGTTPVVAGVVALIKEIRPELRLADIRAILRQSANGSTIVGDTPGWSAAYGAGLLDADAAVTLAQTWVPISEHAPQVAITSPTNAHVVTTGAATDIAVAFTTDEAVTALHLFVDGVLKVTAPNPSGATYTFSYAFETDGPHDVHVVASSAESYLGGYDGVSSTLVVRSLGAVAITSLQEATSLSIADLPPCKTYEVRARTTNTAGSGPWSAWQTVVVPCVAPTIAPAVDILRDASPTQITLGFRQANWATSHQYRVDGGAWIPVTANPFILNKAALAQTVEIQGLNGSGASPIASVTLPALPSVEVTLAIPDSAHGHTTDAVALTSNRLLAIPDSTHGHTTDSISLTSNRLLAIPDSAHGHTTDAVALTSNRLLAIPDSAHGHTTDVVMLALTGSQSLLIPDSAHGQGSDTLDLSSQHSLSISESAHGHTVDGVVLTLSGSANLTVPDNAHAHTADAIALTGNQPLTIPDVTHQHSTDWVVLTQSTYLAAQGSQHAHTSDSLNVSGVPSLAIPDVTHSTQSDSLAVTTTAGLAISDCMHAYLADTIVLTYRSALVITRSKHAHFVDTPTFATGQLVSGLIPVYLLSPISRNIAKASPITKTVSRNSAI